MSTKSACQIDPPGVARAAAFRVIYQERDGALVLLLLIYSKSKRADIPDDAIRRVIAEFET